MPVKWRSIPFQWNSTNRVRHHWFCFATCPFRTPHVPTNWFLTGSNWKFTKVKQSDCVVSVVEARVPLWASSNDSTTHQRDPSNISIPMSKISMSNGTAIRLVMSVRNQHYSMELLQRILHTDVTMIVMVNPVLHMNKSSKRPSRRMRTISLWTFRTSLKQWSTADHQLNLVVDRNSELQLHELWSNSPKYCYWTRRQAL